MKERELLELAAKAGRVNPRLIDGLPVYSPSWEGVQYIKRWNPLSDDGDCAQLESKVGVNVYWFHDRVQCEINGVRFEGVFAENDGDMDKARRWATVNAVALMMKVVEIAKEAEEQGKRLS
jgi:hypothetical protein